ncbi:hypothetical protein KI387_016972, partial [Taxus chinensis]
PVGHIARAGYESTGQADSNTGTNYYPIGPDTGTSIDSRADSGSSTNTWLII